MSAAAARARSLPSRLLFIADAAHAASGVDELVGAARRAGVTFVEIRRPRGARPDGSAERLEEVRRCLAVASGATVLVNDRVDLALLAGASGAHVGQDDMPAADARRLLGPERWLGVSTHDEAQLAAAQHLPVDYVALGPVFASPTKSGHAPPLGLSRLAAARRLSTRPLVAIGGITLENVEAVMACGVDAVAVASAIGAGDVAVNATRWLDAIR